MRSFGTPKGKNLIRCCSCCLRVSRVLFLSILLPEGARCNICFTQPKEFRKLFNSVAKTQCRLITLD